MKIWIPVLLLALPQAAILSEDGCEPEQPDPEPIGMLHSEPGVCDGNVEIQGYNGSTADSGWARLEAIPGAASLIILHDDCTDIEEHCSDGLRLQGSIAVGQGSCNEYSNGVSSSGINLDSGFMGLCSRGDALWVIGVDDCGGLTNYCPTGFANVGAMHVGSGGCDGFPSGKDWQDQPLDSGWMILCVEESTARLVVSSSDC